MSLGTILLIILVIVLLGGSGSVVARFTGPAITVAAGLVSFLLSF